MPTYKYQREDGSTFELWQSINDDPLETCPTTGQKVKRIISGGGGIVFKGDGFYETDYKNKKGVNGSSSEKTENSGGESSGDADTADSAGSEQDD